MYRVLILVFLLMEVSADDNFLAERATAQVQVYSLDDMHHDGQYKHKAHDVHLGDIHDQKRQSTVDRIVSELFNPDYMEPITVLDYRYLKTGGRDYTRGPGGEILILPKGVRTHEKKEFVNFDEMLDYLRKKQLSEHAALQHHPGHAYHKNHIQIRGGHHHHDYNHHLDHYHDQHLVHHNGPNVYGGYKRNAGDIQQDDTLVESETEESESAE